ncbi:hypothetical protein KJ657_00395 [Patescibacteria group bacterium]|nr:hypothetical protein [Patescibacteria group bacterium]MBU1015536.1 hypothetical protein [Patescibacteria group bacterium]MBU1685349.1 hypothetical protein [Patescibacteria group bacterium]MBU1938738.1 hypothetical protein [Patescibacteria group bacterium]
MFKDIFSNQLNRFVYMTPPPDVPKTTPSAKPPTPLSTPESRQLALVAMDKHIKDKITDPKRRVALLNMVESARQSKGKKEAISRSLQLQAALAIATDNKILLDQAHSIAKAHGIELKMPKKIEAPSEPMMTARSRESLYTSAEAKLKKMPDSEKKQYLKELLDTARKAEKSSEYDAIGAALVLNSELMGRVGDAMTKRIYALRDREVNKVLNGIVNNVTGDGRAKLDTGGTVLFKALGKQFLAYKTAGRYGYRAA